MSVVKEKINIFVVRFLSVEVENLVCLDDVVDIKNGRYILVDRLSKIFLLIIDFMIKFLFV